MICRLLILLFFLNVAVAADTTSLSCLARYFREMEENSLPKLDIHPVQKISEFLPVHGNSWEKLNPGISKKLEKIYQSFPDVIAYYRLNPETKLKTIMNMIIESRASRSLEIEKLAELYSQDKLLKNTLLGARGRINLDKSALEKLEGKLNSPLGDEVFNLQNHKHTEMLRSYTSPVDGEFGELLMAMRIGNLEGRGVKYKNLFNTYDEPLRTRAFEKMSELNINGEIDLLYKNDKGVTVWGEVKNYRDPIPSSGKDFDIIYTQAEKTIKMIKALGIKIEAHIYLVNGVSPEAKLALENLGIVVHGKVK